MIMSFRLFDIRVDFRETMGPPALAFAFKLYCNIGQENRLDHSKPYDCRNGHRLHLQPPDAFYGIGHDESSLFFNRHFNDSTVSKLSRSYLSHVYFHTKHKVPLTSLFATLARQYCPTVYDNALAEDF
jgi:Alpha 1,4-glycosyltransferase conserved region